MHQGHLSFVAKLGGIQGGHLTQGRFAYARLELSLPARVAAESDSASASVDATDRIGATPESQGEKRADGESRGP